MSVIHPQRLQFDEDLESKYEIIDVLGGGGMGRVLRARHRQLKRLVAIKLLQHDLRASEAVTRFLREARAAAHIRSVHVAHVLDAGVLRSGQPYIVMEYLQGQDLANMVALRGRLPVDQAISFILQALEAIAEAHTLQIVHRDIKPGNLFATRALAGETLIKVVDFGLAKTSMALDTLDPGVTERGAVLGTPSYMSPEQFVDAQNVDVRADIWGVGATLFELLTGAPPFRGATLPEVYTAVMHSPIPTLRSVAPELPEGLERVVTTCLARDRAQRFANVAELAEALEPYASEASREHVSRIRRIVDGVRQSIDSIELTEELIDGALPVTPAGAISSTYLRGSDRARAAGRGPGGFLRVRGSGWVWIVAIAAVSLGVIAWSFGSFLSPRAMTPHRQLPEPRDDRPVLQAAQRPVPPKPAPAAASPARAAPPPSPLERETSQEEPAPVKPRRRRASAESPPKAPQERSIYEQYP